MKKSLATTQNKLLLSLLREVRQEAGLTQSQMAERLNKPQSFVSKYETGERRLDLIEIHQLCEVVGMSLLTFIERFENSLHDAKGIPNKKPRKTTE